MATALKLSSDGNVVPMRDPIVQKVYKSFMSMHKKNSQKTAEEYNARIQEFFFLTLGKGVEFITIEEIQGIKKMDVQAHFIDELVKKGNSNSTIVTKLNSVRSFYNELLSNDLKVNPMIFKVKLPVDVKHHESMTAEELQSLFEFMKHESELGFEKYLAVKTLFTTANRKTATFNMTWKDSFIIQKDVNTGEDIHVIKVKDKGNKWLYKPISDEFYEELQQLNHGQENVFTMNPKTVERALQKFSKVIGKKITPHSLKATAITLGYKMTKDINLCKQLGGHSSMATTEIYLHKEESLVNQLSYSMSLNLNEDVLDSLTHEELLSFIKSHEDIKNAILMRLRTV